MALTISVVSLNGAVLTLIRKSHILFLTTTGTRVGTFGLTKIEKILLAGGFSSGPS